MQAEINSRKLFCPMSRSGDKNYPHLTHNPLRTNCLLGKRPTMTTHSFLPRSLIFCVVIIGASTTAVLAQEKVADGPEPVDLKAVWNKVVEVNQAWLDPQPKSLSYTIVSGSPPPAVPATTQFVWISGDKARWEMESGEGPQALSYTLILTPEQSQYIRGPQSLLGETLKVRPLNNFRQAITWRSAIHALRKQGMPADAKVVSDTNADGNRQIVVQTKLDGARSSVGLGLEHVFYGSAQWPIGDIKLTLRLPDHVPLREEYADGARIEFGPEFEKIGNGLAPKAMRYINSCGNTRSPWILNAEFQILDGVWLLKSAQNIQNQALVKQMEVLDVSVLPIADEKFSIPAKAE